MAWPREESWLLTAVFYERSGNVVENKGSHPENG
jgi:hypothetical protein